MVPFMEKAPGTSSNGYDVFYADEYFDGDDRPDLCRQRGKTAHFDVFGEEYDEAYESEHIIRLPGMVSRKKQLVPKIIMALGE